MVKLCGIVSQCISQEYYFIFLFLEFEMTISYMRIRKLPRHVFAFEM